MNLLYGGSVMQERREIKFRKQGFKIFFNVLSYRCTMLNWTHWGLKTTVNI